MDEIKSAGGDAIAVGGDVGGDDFPEKVLKATIELVTQGFVTSVFHALILIFPCSKYGKLNHIVNNGA